MKFCAVFLALTILTGSEAASLNEEPARPCLEQIQSTIREYLDKATKMTTENLEAIRNSEFGKELNTRIANSINNAKRYQVELQKQLPPAAQDVVQKAITDLQELHQKVQPVAEDLNKKVQDGISTLRELLAQVEQHAKTVRRALPSGAELAANLQKNMKEVHAQLEPFAEDLKSKIEEFRQGVEPLAQKIQGSLSEGVEQVHQNLKPYAEDFQEKFNTAWSSMLERFQ